MMDKYGLIIIGSGPAGYTAAFSAAKEGVKTALIEKDLNRLGGTCLNEGCIPLKGILHNSIHNKDYASIISGVTLKINSIRGGLKSRLISSGIELIEAEAKFISATEITAGERTLSADNILICCGSRARRFFHQPNVNPPEKIFSLDSVAEKALIIGGGVIGCEYASFLNNIGVNVTVAEVMPSILYGSDQEAVRALAREFKKKKIRVLMNCAIDSVENDGTVCIMTGETQTVDKYGLIIEATGRVPDMGGLNLEAAGVKLTAKGFIAVNNNMQTNVANIYAAGDCVETPMLAYTAYAEAETAVNFMTAGRQGALDYSRIPKLVFSIPQLGSVGYSEEEAAKNNIEFKVYRYFFKAIGKAVVEDMDAGFLKMLAADGRIIGASAVGYEIADMINELAVIINAGVSVETLKRTMHIHPSYSEIIVEALLYGEVK